MNAKPLNFVTYKIMKVTYKQDDELMVLSWSIVVHVAKKPCVDKN